MNSINLKKYWTKRIYLSKLDLAAFDWLRPRAWRGALAAGPNLNAQVLKIYDLETGSIYPYIQDE